MIVSDFLLGKKSLQVFRKFYIKIGKSKRFQQATRLIRCSSGKKPVNPALSKEKPQIQMDGLEAFNLVGDSWAEEGASKPIAILFGFAPWKREASAWFLSDYRVVFARKNTPWINQQSAFSRYTPALFVFWGMQKKKTAIAYAERNRIPVWRIEDDFLRSVGLGAQHVQPLSLAIDKRGMYFDRSQASNLEVERFLRDGDPHYQQAC